VPVTSELFNHYFKSAQKYFSSLKNFNHCYFLSPTDKSTWYSKEEKSKLMIKCLYHFHVETKVPVCAFPVNHGKIENIPDGSDSEEFCILLMDETQQEIIYKERRKGW
jgi:sRNA-binding regulator protein Hfq